MTRILALLILFAVAAPAQENGARILRDLEYSRPAGQSLKLDLYLPEAGKKPAPLVVWIHGGGWRAGSKNRCPAAFLAAHGFAVASVDYRLAPKATFPAQIHDCKAAIRWLRANAKRYHLDPERFGAWGSSAGGHLVALLGTSGGVQALEGEGGNPEHSSRVQAVVDFCGPSALGRMVGKGSAVDAFLGKDGAKNAAAASPVTHASRDDPPFFIVHGDRDRTVPVDQARRLHRALRKVEVNAYLHVIEGAGHNLHDPATHLLAQSFFETQLSK